MRRNVDCRAHGCASCPVSWPLSRLCSRWLPGPGPRAGRRRRRSTATRTSARRSERSTSGPRSPPTRRATPSPSGHRSARRTRRCARRAGPPAGTGRRPRTSRRSPSRSRTARRRRTTAASSSASRRTARRSRSGRPRRVAGNTVRAAHQPASGGSWLSDGPLSAIGDSTDMLAFAQNRAGDMVAAWRDDPPVGSSQIEVRRATCGSAAGSRYDVLTSPNESGLFPSAAVDENGSYAIAWNNNDAAGEYVRLAFRAPAAGTWSYENARTIGDGPVDPRLGRLVPRTGGCSSGWYETVFGSPSHDEIWSNMKFAGSWGTRAAGFRRRARTRSSSPTSSSGRRARARSAGSASPTAWGATPTAPP